MHWETASFLALAFAFSGWEQLRPAWGIDRRATLGVDLLAFAVAIAAAMVSRKVVTGAADQLGLARIVAPLSGLPFAVKLPAGLLAVDFSIYWIHRAQHRYAFAWRMHRAHHSIEQMHWLSGFRTSLLHSLFYNVPQTVVPIHVLQLSATETAIGYSIGLFVQFWDHANADARLGPLKYAFIRPQDHRLHHAASSEAVNFGFVFCWWDRCFGTYRDGDTVPGPYALGLRDHPAGSSLPRMLVGI